MTKIPIPIEVYPTREDKVDLVAADLFNVLQNSVVTLEKALNLLLNTDGTIVQGTSFPVSPIEGQMFWRSDLASMYVYSVVNTLWEVLGGTLSNVLFRYEGQVDQQGTKKGEFTGTSLVPSSGTGNYRFLWSPNTSLSTIWTSKFVKIAGINTVTVYTRLWNNVGDHSVSLQVTIGSASGTGSLTATTPTWGSFTIDVSGLSNGTAYDVTAQIVSGGSSDANYCSNIIGFGS